MERTWSVRRITGQLTLERDDVDWPNGLLFKLHRWSDQEEKALKKIAALHNYQMEQLTEGAQR